MKADNKALEASKVQLIEDVDRLTKDLNELRNTIQDSKGEITDLKEKNMRHAECPSRAAKAVATWTPETWVMTAAETTTTRVMQETANGHGQEMSGTGRVT